MSNSKTYAIVMRRVRTIHALRTAASGAGFSLLALVVSLYFIGRKVWVARVWQNAPTILHVSALFHFSTYAFIHTSFTVQLLLLISIAALVWIAREISRIAFISIPRLA